MGGTAYVYAADLSDMESVDRLVERVLADHRSVDMLVNNAGRSIRRSITALVSVYCFPLGSVWVISRLVKSSLRSTTVSRVYVDQSLFKNATELTSLKTASLNESEKASRNRNELR